MNAIRVALERTPPELSADISDRGIVLTAVRSGKEPGQAHPRRDRFAGVDCRRPVVQRGAGTGKMLSDFKLLRKISID